MAIVKPETILDNARRIALKSKDSESSAVILELCAEVDKLVASATNVRRDAFRDAIHGIGNAIRNDRVPQSIAWARDIPGPFGTPEELAHEIEATNATELVNVTELRQLRQKIKAASDGDDAIDKAVRRIYYATLYKRNPSTTSILPPGSPSRSIDLAAFITERLLPNGWWTMGSSGENLTDAPVAKVGTWTGDNPKAETASTSALALLSALILTMIEATKKDS